MYLYTCTNHIVITCDYKKIYYAPKFEPLNKLMFIAQK